MKLFYDENGKVIGSVTGASPEIEAAIKVPDTKEIYVPPELAEKLDSPDDALSPRDLCVENDEIIVPDTNTPDAPAS